MHSTRRWFLAVVAVLFLTQCSSCALWDYPPTNRNRQSETVGWMLKLNMALERVARECDAYPVDLSFTLGTDCSQPSALIRTLVEQKYLAEPIVCDGWNHVFQYATVNIGVPEVDPKTIPPKCRSLFGEHWVQNYVIYSPGRDGQPDCGLPRWIEKEQRFVLEGKTTPGCPSGCSSFDPSNYDCDILFSRTGLISGPQGGVGGD